ncbi:NINE protein [Plesiomonas shigelloides]|uniref:TM2 domain-containing protein n=1 Tax=Plesiomonas shigelloides TaxID=703 RepID=UPI00351D3C40
MDATSEGKMIFCRGCGKQIHSSAHTCPMCGAPQVINNISEKRILPAFLLCFFIGIFGAHRFYVGKTGTGIIQIITLGGFGIWTFIDCILIIVGAFTDKQGKKLTQWT